jgi:hypothetical protein
MDRIRRLCRCLAGLSRRAGTQLAFAVAAPTAARWPDPPPPPAWKFLPGWNKYLPLPGWDKHPRLPLGHVAGPVYQGAGRIPARAATTAGSMPGWLIIFIAAGAALLAVVLAVLVHRLRAARRRPTVRAA